MTRWMLAGVISMAVGCGGAGKPAPEPVGNGDTATPTEPATGAMVEQGEPNAVGELDKPAIRAAIHDHIGEITACYEKYLLEHPDAAGTVTAQFLIGGDGKVVSATAAGIDPAVADCVAQVVQAVQFPAPTGGGEVQVSYPFAFRSSGG